jgi:hypothetical protein
MASVAIYVRGRYLLPDLGYLFILGQHLGENLSELVQFEQLVLHFYVWVQSVQPTIDMHDKDQADKVAPRTGTLKADGHAVLSTKIRAWSFETLVRHVGLLPALAIVPIKFSELQSQRFPLLTIIP